MRITGLLAPDEQLEDASTARPATSPPPPTTPSAIGSTSSRDAVVANRALVEFVLAHELDPRARGPELRPRRGGERLDDDAALAQPALDRGLGDRGDGRLRAPATLDPSDLLARDRGHRRTAPAACRSSSSTSSPGPTSAATSSSPSSAASPAAGSWSTTRSQIAPAGDAPSRSSTPPSTSTTSGRCRSAIDGTALRQAGWRPRRPRRARRVRDRAAARASAPTRRSRSRAAAGWGGDRYELWRRAAHPAGVRGPLPLGPRARRSAWRWDSAAGRGAVRPRGARPTSSRASAATVARA